MSIPTWRKRTNLWLLAIAIPLLFWGFGHLENHMVYVPDAARDGTEPLNQVLNPDLKKQIRDLYFTTNDNIRLNAWYIPAQNGKPTVVFAHGNGGNLGNRWSVLEAFTRHGYGIFAFDYRGYGKSEGSCSEQGLYQDMEAASRYLTKEYDVPFQQQIALGGSLGTGVAINTATRIPYRAVVLYAAYTSTPDVAAHLQHSGQLHWLGWVPVHLLMRQRFESINKIAGIHSPILIMQGSEDAMMPVTMPQALYAQATTPHKKLLIIEGAGHNNVFSKGEARLFTALEQLLAESEQGDKA